MQLASRSNDTRQKAPQCYALVSESSDLVMLVSMAQYIGYITSNYRVAIDISASPRILRLPRIATWPVNFPQMKPWSIRKEPTKRESSFEIFRSRKRFNSHRRSRKKAAGTVDFAISLGHKIVLVIIVNECNVAVSGPRIYERRSHVRPCSRVAFPISKYGAPISGVFAGNYWAQRQFSIGIGAAVDCLEMNWTA